VLRALTTTALLRAGFDTVACTLGWTLLQEGAGPDLAGIVAGRIWFDPEVRRRHLRRAEADAARVLRETPGPGVRILSITDEDYPRLLRTIPDPPLVLWVWGQTAALSRPSIGIVGSRAATPTGLNVARTLGRHLAEASLNVVSGLARGVDGAAHEGALAGGGTTVGVLGCGIDCPYPSQHRRLAEEMTQAGAVITELPPGTQPLPQHFPLRNRIISGLCKAVVVVEASEHSGSLITARMALEQGRDVLAVPGSVLSGKHVGCHRLIKDGARLVETVGDIFEEIGWVPPASAQLETANHLQLSDLEANMAVGEPYSVEDLARETGRSPLELLPELGRLEVAGRLTRLPGGKFARFAGTGSGE
jgi:DNA processing protein